MSEQGILAMAADEYHAGPGDVPRLSSSIAHILWSRTPLHAWTAHPRLNPNYERADDGKFDLGTVAHSVLLQGEDIVYVVHENDWKKNVAKEAREYARELGKVPLLAKDWDRVQQMCETLREKLPAFFVDGQPEVSLIWSEDGVDFKARIDWLLNDHSVIRDLKTTSQLGDWEKRQPFAHGYDIQVATYRRAVEAVYAQRPRFEWCVIEVTPPYEFRLIRPGADVLAAGERKLEWAIAKWRECMASGEWPGYDREIVEAELPAWEEAKLLEREAA